MIYKKITRLSYRINKKLIEYAISINWIIVSTVTKKINRGVSSTLTSRNVKKIYFIVPNKQNYIINDGLHPQNIEVLGAPFLRREFNAEIVEITDSEIEKIRYEQFSVFATHSAGVAYDWRFFAYFFKIIKLGLKLKSKKMPIIFIISDSFYPDSSAIGSILTSLTGGCLLAGPNPSNEMKTYGHLNVIWPVIWVDIVHKIRKASSSSTKFSMRQNACLVASGLSATPLRINRMSKLKHILANFGIQVIESDGLLPEDEYIKKLGEIKFYATTNYTQEIYFFGPKFYQRKISKTALTGRTYNAFASGMVLIANECASMKQMGFYKNIHYLELEELINNYNYILPPQNDLEEIAFNGRLKLNSILDQEVLFNNYDW